MPRIAAIDVGTNTALLLVADVGDGGMEVIHEQERFVRLGEGVDANGHIGPDAQDRLVETLTLYRGAAEAWQADRIVAAATSAARDAANRDEVAVAVRKRTGIELRVVSGHEEAVLSFRGATSAFADLTGRCAVLDIGGGSTELIVGDAQGAGETRFVRSLDVGAVRLTERCFSAQPPPAAEIRAAAALVEEALAVGEVPRDTAMPLVGAAGTPTALAMVHCGIGLEAVRREPPSLAAGVVREWRDRLFTLTHAEVLALHDEAMPGRADVFHAGVLLLDAVMQRLGAERMRVSPRGLRHGLALQAA